MLGILLIGFPRFEFEWKFGVVQFLTIVLTFVITFYLQQAITRRSGDDRVEKGIIIEQAKNVTALVTRIAELCRASASGELDAEKARGALGEFKGLNQELATLSRLMDATPIVLDLDYFRRLQKACLRLKRLATCGAFPSQPLTSGEYRKVQTAANATSDLACRLIFYVNRA